MLEDPAPLSALVSPGTVTASTARLWMRSPHPGPVSIRLHEEEDPRPVAEATIDVAVDEAADCTTSVLLPDDVPGLPPLRPNTLYRVSVHHRATDALVGHARFTTSPLGADDSPPVMSFAIASCNQPFEDDGSPSDKARALARVMPDALRTIGVSRLLLMGDQMYADMPEGLSLFDDAYFRAVAPPGRASILDCSREEVRRIFQLRYRHFWKLPEMQELLSQWAGDCRPDDHEILDNFGAAPEHAAPRYQNLRDGAFDAFFDYQGQRAFPRTGDGRPASFDHAFEHGSIAFFAADLRSEKHADEQRTRVLSERQFEALEQLLARSGDKHVVVVILSVPILHVPDWIATAAASLGGEDSDAADRWAYAKASADRDRMLQLLCAHQTAHPRQRIVMVGGDVHVGLACQYRWERAPRPIYQLVSSALTHVHHPWLERLAEEVPFPRREVCDLEGRCIEGELLPGVGELDRNPVGDLNFGTVHVRRIAPDESIVRLRLYTTLERDDGCAVQCVYDSGEL